MKTLLKELFRAATIVMAAFLLLALGLQTAKAVDCADNDAQCWELAAKAQWRDENGDYQKNFDELTPDTQRYITYQAEQIQKQK